METWEVAAICTATRVPSGATSPAVDLLAPEAISEEASHGEAWAQTWVDAAATETRLTTSMICEQ